MLRRLAPRRPVVAASPSLHARPSSPAYVTRRERLGEPAFTNGHDEHRLGYAATTAVNGDRVPAPHAVLRQQRGRRSTEYSGQSRVPSSETSSDELYRASGISVIMHRCEPGSSYAAERLSTPRPARDPAVAGCFGRPRTSTTCEPSTTRSGRAPTRRSTTPSRRSSGVRQRDATRSRGSGGQPRVRGLPGLDLARP